MHLFASIKFFLFSYSAKNIYSNTLRNIYWQSESQTTDVFENKQEIKFMKAYVSPSSGHKKLFTKNFQLK